MIQSYSNPGAILQNVFIWSTLHDYKKTKSNQVVFTSNELNTKNGKQAMN